MKHGDGIHRIAKDSFFNPMGAARNALRFEMCSGSGAGSYLRLIDFVYHSTLGLRVIKKNKKTPSSTR